MSFSVSDLAAPTAGSGTDTQPQEWVVTMANGVVTRIERIDRVSHRRIELSMEEYTELLAVANPYTAYYAGIRDYAAAIATGNLEMAQAYYQGMTDYFAAAAQQ
jgi:hypothetical protein